MIPKSVQTNFNNGMKIMIPIDNVDSVGLRKVIDRAMVSKVYKILRQKKVETDQQTWNRRYREYTEKIKTGSVLEIAKVLRDARQIKPETQWVHFGGVQPSVIPAGRLDSKKDLTIYDNVAAVIRKGMDFLNNYAIHIDHSNNRILLSPRTGE